MQTNDSRYELHIPWHFPHLRKYAFFFISLLILLLAVYGNSFHGEWHFDDIPNIIENPNVHLKNLSLKGIYNAFHFRGDLARPVSYLSLAINYYFGGLETFGYHLINFIIHYVTAIFLFLFIFNTLRLPLLRDRYGENAYAISILATVFWAINPVQVLAVSYVVQRMASMAGMFYIAAMYFYLKGRTAEGIKNRALFFLCCAVATLLAFGSKETAAMLPVSLFIYDLFLIQGADRETVRKNLKFAFIPFAVVIILANSYLDLSSILDDYRVRSYTVGGRLITEPRVIIFYISLLLYPIHSRLTMLHDFDISKSLIDPWTTLPAMLIIVFSVGYALTIARKRPLISFCILFFFLNHLIEGSFVPVELIYEHRNYIPSMLFFVPVVIFILRMLDYFAYRKAIRWLIVFSVIFVLFAEGHTVYMRNEVLKTDMALWIDNILKYPRLSRPHNNLGIHYTRHGLREAGMGEFIEASSLNNYENLTIVARTEINMGNFYLNEGQDDMAFTHYRKAIWISPTNAQPYAGIAQINLRRGDTDRAYEYIRKALKIKPHAAEYRELFSLILLRRGSNRNAAIEASKVLQQDFNRTFPRLILAEVQWQKRIYDRAILTLKDLLRIDPLYAQAYLFLIDIYDKKGDKDALGEAVSSLVHLKGDRKLEEFVRIYAADKFSPVHKIDADRILSIIKRTLMSQAAEIKIRGRCPFSLKSKSRTEVSGQD
jgi:tetratricopeptide (TPR) repeat protein